MNDDGKTYSGSCATCQHSTYRDELTMNCMLLDGPVIVKRNHWCTQQGRELGAQGDK